MFRRVFTIALLLVIVTGAASLLHAPDASAKKPGEVVVPAPNDDNDDCPRVIIGGDGEGGGFYCIRVTYCSYNCYPMSSPD